jgi:DNA-binding CsgD family transcriptional regulator
MMPSIALKVMRYFAARQVPAILLDYKLTIKENEVLNHLATGLSYKMIVDQMGISYFTVNNHVKKNYEKLQVHSLGEAVAIAYKKNLF